MGFLNIKSPKECLCMCMLVVRAVGMKIWWGTQGEFRVLVVWTEKAGRELVLWPGCPDRLCVWCF